jgi:hypothetical protein
MGTNNTHDAKDKWEAFRFFIGNWKGTATGKPGNGSVERSYALTLADQFIEINNRSVYPPQESNPEGEVHDDLGLLSYDKARARFVMREFHVEGYVNQYVMEPQEPDDTSFVFVTESIENIPPGWRARTTWEINSEDSFRETFDLAGPEKEWACYIINEFQRVS